MGKGRERKRERETLSLYLWLSSCALAWKFRSIPSDCATGWLPMRTARTCAACAQRCTRGCGLWTRRVLGAARSPCSTSTQTWKIVTRNPVRPLSWPCTLSFSLLYSKSAVFYNTSADTNSSNFSFFRRFRASLSGRRGTRGSLKRVNYENLSLSLSLLHCSVIPSSTVETSSAVSR